MNDKNTQAASATSGELKCPHCGTHEFALYRECHNSACSHYATSETVYEGWRAPQPVEAKGAAGEVLAWLIHSGDVRKPVLTVYSESEAAGYHPQWVVPLSRAAAPAPQAAGIKTWQERQKDAVAAGKFAGFPDEYKDAEIADLRAALQRPVPAQAAGDELAALIAARDRRYPMPDSFHASVIAQTYLMHVAYEFGWQDRAALSQQTEAAEPIASTFMTSEQAAKWAWEQVRRDVGTEGWTTGDSCNYYGFFLYGFRYGKQYECQRAAPVTAAAGGELDEETLFEAWAKSPIRADKLPLEKHPNRAYKSTNSYLVAYGWKNGYRAAIAASLAHQKGNGDSLNVSAGQGKEDAHPGLLDDNELTRLRRVVRLLGLERAVPEDDATLRGCLFSVLGIIARELERRAQPAQAGADEAKKGVEKWSYSTDEESYHEQEPSRMAIIQFALSEIEESNEDATEFWIGRNVRFSPRASAIPIVESLQEQAYDECGEFADTYLEDVTKAEEAELEALVNEWANRVDRSNFWTVGAVEHFTIESARAELAALAAATQPNQQGESNV